MFSLANWEQQSRAGKDFFYHQLHPGLPPHHDPSLLLICWTPASPDWLRSSRTGVRPATSGGAVKHLSGTHQPSQPAGRGGEEGGEHSHEVGGGAGCSNGGHRSAAVAPSAGHNWKDSCGHPGGSSPKAPVNGE